MIYLDTHVVVMLHAAFTEKIPQKAQRLIDASQTVLISPMVHLEMQYLYELDKIYTAPGKILDDLAATLGLQLCNLPFSIVATKAVHETWTRDPFDRIITAQARIDNVPLLTRDRAIHKHYSQAVWS